MQTGQARSRDILLHRYSSTWIKFIPVNSSAISCKHDVHKSVQMSSE